MDEDEKNEDKVVRRTELSFSGKDVIGLVIFLWIILGFIGIGFVTVCQWLASNI